MDLEAEKQKARELVAKSEQVALLLPSRPSIDCMAAAEVISRTLAAREKHVGFLPSVSADAPPPAEEFTNILNPYSLTREFVIAVDTAHSPIGQLRYEKHEGRLEIILSPKAQPIREDALSFREGKLQCDCLVAVGVPDIEALSSAALGVEPQFFAETPIVSIGNSPDQKSYGEVNLTSPPDTPLSELAYEFVKAISAGPLGGSSATLLLAGIINATDNFRSPVLVATHLAAAELLQIGADQAAASLIAQTNQPFSLLQLTARASVRSKESDAGRILWSFLTAEDFEKTGRRGEDAPAVLSALPRFFTPHPIGVLLWQDPVGRQIHGMIRGRADALSAIAAREPGEMQNPAFTLAATFLNFIEAEERIGALLREVL